MSGVPLMATIVRWVVILPLLVAPALTRLGAADDYELAAGEINEGDLYLFSGSVRIDGEQDGDLVVFGRTLEINGVVKGRINAWTQRVEVGGDLQETARLFAQTIRVNGTVDGDLLAIGQTVAIGPEARITGSLQAGGADVTIDGTIEGDVDATGGMIVMRGAVNGDVELEAETIDIDPGARIEGDLVYVTRNELEFDEEKIVGGTIDWDPSGDKVKADVDVGSGRLTRMIVALLVGLAAVAIFSKQTPAIVARVAGDGLRSAGIGFITFVVVPVAGLLACVLIVTIPLVFIAGLAFGLLVYLAKVPVAIWIGQLILARLGRSRSAPYLSLLIGIAALYAAFLIPYIGKLAWWASLFVGLGAIVLYISDLRQQRRSPEDAAPITHPSPGTTPSPTPHPS